MSDEKKKEKISAATYGELITDCADCGLNYGVGAFFLSTAAIPASLMCLDKLVKTRIELKACAAVCGAIVSSIYVAKRVRENCDKEIHEKYEI